MDTILTTITTVLLTTLVFFLGNRFRRSEILRAERIKMYNEVLDCMYEMTISKDSTTIKELKNKLGVLSIKIKIFVSHESHVMIEEFLRTPSKIDLDTFAKHVQKDIKI